VYFTGPKIYFTKFWLFVPIHHLALHLKTSKNKCFRASEGGLWWPPAGLGKVMLDWLGKVRLG